eukprot:scaffold537_cov180-Ochromonas_danica.AAC.81
MWSYRQPPFLFYDKAVLNGNQAHVSPRRSSQRPRKEWNSYLTENKFSLSQEEVARRKALFVSKHNILSEQYSPPPPPAPSPAAASRAVRRRRRKGRGSVGEEEEEESYLDDEGPNSLDLLTLTSEDEEEEKEEEEEHVDQVQRRNLPPPPPATTSSRRLAATTTTTPAARGGRKKKTAAAATAVSSSSSSPAKSPLPISSPKHKPSSSSSSCSSASKKKVIVKTERAVSQPAPPPPAPAAAAEGDSDMEEIHREVSVLLEELRAYETMTGRQSSSSSFSAQALQDVYSGASVTPKQVLRFLVQLVCQTMTHLLEKELDHSHLLAQLEALSLQHNQLLATVQATASFTSSSSALPRHQVVSGTPTPPPAATATATASSREAAATPSKPPLPQPQRTQSQSQYHVDVYGEGRRQSLLDSEETVELSHHTRSYAQDGRGGSWASRGSGGGGGWEEEQEEGQWSTSKSLEEMEHLIAQSRQIASQLSPAALEAINSGLSTTARLTPAGDHVLFTPPPPPPAAPATSSSAVIGPAEAAGLELRAKEKMLQDASALASSMAMGFTGTSATDFLFLPSPPAAATTTTTTPATPVASYHPSSSSSSMAMSAADRASHTFDLYLQSMTSTTSRRERQKEQEEEDEDAMVATTNVSKSKLTDSYEDMIERLSYKFSSHKLPNSNHGTEEEDYLLSLQTTVPRPMAAVPHPLVAAVNRKIPVSQGSANKKVKFNAFFATKELFPPSPDRSDPRVIDTTNGYF